MLAASEYSWILALRLSTVFMGLGLAWFYHIMLPLLRGRRAVFALCGGFVFALCQAIGEVILFAYPLRNIPLLLLGYLPLYAALVCGAFSLLDSRAARAKQAAAAAPRFVRLEALLARLLCGKVKPTLVLWGILLLLWLPYHLLFWPGVASPDTTHQICQALGAAPFTSHHPPFHTLWLGLCMRVGNALFGSYAAGLGLATATQLLAMALLCACTMAFMARLSIGLGWRAAALLFYGLAPVYGWYAAILWKDIWLGCFCLLFLFCCLGVIRQRGAYFRSPGQVLLLALSVLGVIVSKNNGIHIVLLTALALLLSLKGARRQMATVLLLGVLLWQGAGALYKAMGAEEGDLRETLSVPLLQVALVLRDELDALAPEDVALIAAVLPYYDEMAERYDSTVADGVKNGFKTDVYRRNAAAYNQLYLRLGLRYPALYLRAILEHTFAYYFPDAPFGWANTIPYTSFIRIYPDALPTGLDPMQGRYAEHNFAAAAWVGENAPERSIPGLASIFTPGFYFWLLLLCGLWAWYKRLYIRLLALAMPFAVWLTCLASPVNGSFRYAFPVVMAAPLLLGYMMMREDTVQPPTAKE